MRDRKRSDAILKWVKERNAEWERTGDIHLGSNRCVIGGPENEDDFGLGDGGSFLPAEVGDDVAASVLREGSDEGLPLSLGVDKRR